MTTLKHEIQHHVAIFGSSGSGKSGAILAKVEDLILADVPVLLVDNKGDLLNIALQTNLDIANKQHVRLITPGSKLGDSVALLSSLRGSGDLTEAVSSLCELVGVSSDPIKSQEHAFLSRCVEERNKESTPWTLIDLIQDCTNPPFESLGTLPVDQVFSPRKRGALQNKLNNLFASPSFEAWRYGVDLDIASWLDVPQGKVPVIVFSVAHMVSDPERIAALTLLFNAIVTYMRSGTHSDLKLAVVVDECFGILPPSPKEPPTKKPILTLIKQGRAFGVGVILATQNPMDIDYRAMANCNTWYVGKLATANDRRRVIEGLGVDKDEKGPIETSITSLKPREFVCVDVHRNFTKMRFSDVSCTLVGPMGPPHIDSLYLSKLLQPKSLISMEQGYHEALSFLRYYPNDANRRVVQEYERRLGITKPSAAKSFFRAMLDLF